MSKPNLPPLPTELESVYVSVDGLSTYREARDCYYTMDHMYAYAEEAVRQALAAQEVRAWLIRDRKNGTDPMFTIATTTEPFASTYWPLAIIPETRDG